MLNPTSLPGTSDGNVIYVTDVPVIDEVQIGPSPASVVEDITAAVTQLTNVDTALPVTYRYAWYQDGVLLPAFTNAILPSSATQTGSSYTCEITPLKGSNITGTPVTTSAVSVLADKDGNGIHDQWESDHHGDVAEDPDGDADFDGLSNRVEYLFGLDPNDGRSNVAIIKPLCRTSCTFKYCRPTLKLPTITYRVWTSPDLVNWTEHTPVTESQNSVDGLTETMEIGIDSALVGAHPRLYVRVSAD